MVTRLITDIIHCEIIRCHVSLAIGLFLAFKVFVSKALILVLPMYRTFKILWVHRGDIDYDR